MLSRITIEVDFDNGNLPVIQILQKNSDDVRDRLINQFLEDLRHSSQWCKILFKGSNETSEDQSRIKKWIIRPIIPEEFAGEGNAMLAAYNPPPSPKQ